MSRKQPESGGGAAFSAFLADVLDDTGFYPGLKARPHAGTAAEFIALCDRELEDAGEEPEDDELQEWLGLEVEISRRREEAEIEAEEGEEKAARRSRARRRPSVVPPAPAGASPGDAVADTARDRASGGDRPGAPRPAKSRTPDPETSVGLTAKGKARLRRLAAARRDVDAFTPGNGVQRRLVGLVSTMLGFMERNLCKPGRAEELDRWWRLVGAYRRALDFPELAGPQRRAAFERLMKLDAERLFAAARRGRISGRMPRSKRKERGWEAWRAYV